MRRAECGCTVFFINVFLLRTPIWGNDIAGQVSDTPTGTFAMVSAGHGHSVALRFDGTLLVWGDRSSAAVQETPTGAGFEAVVAGYDHSVAIRSDGTLVSWGDDKAGQIRSTPTAARFKY